MKGKDTSCPSWPECGSRIQGCHGHTPSNPEDQLPQGAHRHHGSRTPALKGPPSFVTNRKLDPARVHPPCSWGQEHRLSSDQGQQLWVQLPLRSQARICAVPTHVLPQESSFHGRDSVATCVSCQLDPGVLLLEGHDKRRPVHHVLYFPP